MLCKQQISCFSNQLLLVVKRRYPKDDNHMKGFEITMREYAESRDRRLLIALLVSRALASVILKVGASDGSHGAVTEMMAICNDTVS